MPETSRGYTYPASTASTRLWEHFEALATDIDADVEAVETATEARFLYAYKASSESLPSSTTFQDDDELFITLPVGVWKLDVVLMTSGAAAADIKVIYSFTGGSTGTPGRICFGPQVATTDATATTARLSSHGTGTAVSYGLDGGVTSAIKEELLWQVSSAGVLTVQWAQVTSNATPTVVAAGSRIIATRVG